MSHSFIKCHVHAVFSTKQRRKIIPKQFQPQLWAYMAGICRNLRMAPIAINGMDDHAHMLYSQPPSLSVADAIRLVKTNSSKWMGEQGFDFAWQTGYGAFSVSWPDTPKVARYIRNQEEHHRTITFEEEYKALLRENGIDFDPEHLFE